MTSPTIGLQPRMQREDFSLDELDAGLSDVLATSATSAVTEGPTTLRALGIGELEAAKSSQFNRPDFVKALESLEGGADLGDVADTLRGSIPSVPRADAEARIKDAGLSHVLKLPAGESIREPALAIMLDRARTRVEREATLARGPHGVVPTALSVGTSFLVGALDPLNVAAAFVPVVGELRYAKLLESAGTSAMRRIGVRAGVGALEGGVGMAALQPIDWFAHSQEGQDFTMAEALRNVAFGAGLGAGLRSGGGAIADVFRGRARKPLYPFAEGEMAGPVPAAPEAGGLGASGGTARSIEDAHDAVYNDVADQLRAAGVPEDQIAPNAAVMAANFTALAEQTGRQFGDAVDLYKEAGIGVRGGAPEAVVGRAFEQAHPQSPTFYSAVSRAVEASKQAKAPADQWLGTLKNAAGVKPEEMEWLGLADWLKEQKGPVTKDQVLDYVRANQVEVKEVTKQGGGRGLDEIAIEMFGKPYEQLRKIEQRKAVMEQHRSEKMSVGVKFGQYTIPNGENYRELLLTLPEKPRLERRYVVIDESGVVRASQTSRAGAEIYMEPGRRIEERGVPSPLETGNTYRSSHWDEPNVLAHVRMNDRTIPRTPQQELAAKEWAKAEPELIKFNQEIEDITARLPKSGYDRAIELNNAIKNNWAIKFTDQEAMDLIHGKNKVTVLDNSVNKLRDLINRRDTLIKSLPDRPPSGKSLHIEEIQSDWHQAGRRKGYRSENETKLANLIKERDAIGKELHGLGRDAPYTEEVDRRLDRMNELHDQIRELRDSTSGVPDAPFKKTWPELALKRMIRYAAENGYDKITWTTGETQAARYDLSKQISKIEYEPSEGGKYEISATDLKGKEVLHEDEVPLSRVEELVGKEIAQKIENREGERTHGPYREWRALSGLNLKVGGEGMKAFYDSELPARMTKLVKKFGGKVEQAELPEAGGRRVGLYDQGGALIQEFETVSDASHWDMLHPVLGGGREIKQLPNKPELVHSLDITPELRKVAVEQGFPLFQSGEGSPRGRITLSQGRAIIDLFEKADASTFMHEAAHFFLEQRIHLADRLPENSPLRKDLATVLDWLGVAKPEDIGTEQHERFARGFETYLAEGKAPSEKLAGAFEKFKQWLIAIYHAIANINSPINDNVRAVFDRMLATEGETARRPSPVMEALADLPPQAKYDAMRAAIAALHEGEQVRVGEMLIEAAKTDPRIAESVALMGEQPDARPTEPPAAAPAGAEPAKSRVAPAIAPQGEPGAVSAERPPVGVDQPAAAASEGAIAIKPKPARGPAARPEQTWSLLEFLAWRGGVSEIDPLVSDLRTAIGRDNKFVPGFGPLIRKGGMSFDRAREAAVEAGYLIDEGAERNSVTTTTIDTLLSAVDDELRGRRVYRRGHEPESTKRETERATEASRHQREMALDEAIAEIGGDATFLSKEQRSRVIEIMERELIHDPHEAMEREALEWVQNAADQGHQERIADDIPGWDVAHAGPAAPAGGAIAEVGRSGGAEAGGDVRAAGGLAGPEGRRLTAEPTAAGSQIVLPGAEQSARQLAAAREAQGRGRMASQKPQDAPGGLFAQRAEEDPDMFAVAAAAKAVEPPAATPKKRLQAALAAEQEADAMFRSMEATLDPAQRERVAAALSEARIAGSDAQEVLSRGVGCLVNAGAGL